MAKEYKDIKGNILTSGDKVLTIQVNGRAPGGSLVEAYFLVDEKGKGYLSKSLTPTWIDRHNLYSRNFDEKVYKI